MTTAIHCERCGEVQFSDVFVGLVLSDKEMESVEQGLLLLHNSMMHGKDDVQDETRNRR